MHGLSLRVLKNELCGGKETPATGLCVTVLQLNEVQQMRTLLLCNPLLKGDCILANILEHCYMKIHISNEN